MKGIFYFMEVFQIDSDAAQTAVICLSILKSVASLYGNKAVEGKIPFEASWDEVHEFYSEAFDLCANNMRVMCSADEYTEYCGVDNNDMTLFFSLAYKLGDGNIFLKMADANYRNTLCNVGNYSFSCRLYRSEKRKPRLMLIMDAEYYPNAEVIYQLYQFFSFFKQMIPVLQTEINKQKNKPIRMKKAGGQPHEYVGKSA